VLLARGVSAPPVHPSELPWRGTPTAGAREARATGLGIESRPSSEGLICSVER
jgi:hypothetical protein